METAVLGPSRGFDDDGGGGGEVRAAGVVGLVDSGVCVVDGAFEWMFSAVSSSSSIPNDSFPLVSGFRFFFGRSVGVVALFFDN